MACNLARADDWINTPSLDDRARHPPEGIGIARESKKRHEGLCKHGCRHDVGRLFFTTLQKDLE